MNGQNKYKMRKFLAKKKPKKKREIVSSNKLL